MGYVAGRLRGAVGLRKESMALGGDAAGQGVRPRVTGTGNGWASVATGGAESVPEWLCGPAGGRAGRAGCKA